MVIKDISCWGLLSVLVSLSLSACTTLPKTQTFEQKSQDIASNIKPPPKTKKDYLTYTLDLSEDATQSQAAIEGTFVLKDGCFILDHGSGFYSTPMFPDSISKWNKKDHIMTVNGIPFGLGDRIYTNGGYYLYGPDANTQLEEEIDKKCLMPSISFLGTFDLEKRSNK